MRSRYISTAELAATIGFSARWLTARAAAGEIPGARQPAGPRGKWVFDEAQFWRWWETRGAKPTHWRPPLGASVQRAALAGVKAAPSGRALRRHISEWKKRTR